MEIEKQINIERAYRTDALSSFFCGVREIDPLIHKKENLNKKSSRFLLSTN